MNSLDPVKRVGSQIASAIRLHEPQAKSADVAARIAELLGTVGLPRGVERAYAHQLSGGQRQRVMIALALACRPSLVIADEPTTALDVVMQAQILELLERLRAELGLALILISHDLSVLAETCDRIAVMYAGPDRRDRAGRRRLQRAAAPVHQAAARVAAGDRRRRASSPRRSPAARPTRPTRRRGLRVPPPLPVRRRCMRGGAGAARGRAGPVGGLPLRALGALARARARRGGARMTRSWRPATSRCTSGAARALDGVSLEWRRGEVLGDRRGVGLRQVDARPRAARARARRRRGSVLADGTELGGKASLRRCGGGPDDLPGPVPDAQSAAAGARRSWPSRSWSRAWRRPSTRRGSRGRSRRSGSRRRASPTATRTSSPAASASAWRSRPTLVLEPGGIVCDEPVSMLDVSVRSQILHVLLELQRARELALLFITHDLSLAWQLCDRIAVMYLGRIVEQGDGARRDRAPAGIPTRRRWSRRCRRASGAACSRGELPDAAALPTGCRFHPRCPKRFEPATRWTRSSIPAGEPAHEAACLLLRGDSSPESRSDIA